MSRLLVPEVTAEPAITRCWGLLLSQSPISRETCEGTQVDGTVADHDRNLVSSIDGRSLINTL